MEMALDRSQHERGAEPVVSLTEEEIDRLRRAYDEGYAKSTYDEGYSLVEGQPKPVEFEEWLSKERSE